MAHLSGSNPKRKPQTMFKKIWDRHVIKENRDGTCLLYIDRHLVHEVTSPQAFEGLRMNNRRVRRREKTLAVSDHNVSTSIHRVTEENPDQDSVLQLKTLQKNCRDFGIEMYDIRDYRQGIVHVVGPEQGFTLPGTTVVCGDSHTSTHGAVGALAFGIGTSEVEHVLATQSLWQKPAKTMLIDVNGTIPPWIYSKDVILGLIGKIGTAGGTGYAIEYAGEVIRNFSVESRLSICNMSIEAGARTGLIAPDEKTFKYFEGRPKAPQGENFEKAVAYWKTLPTDEGATFDRIVNLDVSEMDPQITWGTSPEEVVPITGHVPTRDEIANPEKRNGLKRALEYMGLKEGQALEGLKLDNVFIGSCTNGRIEDLRLAASIVKGKKVASHVHATVVPGSGLVKKQAEEEELDKVFKEAGFDWRAAGCSMCLGMNADILKPKARCASTSNRNFEGRQGRGGRTHLMSPIMAAAAAIEGCLTDVRHYI